MRFTKMHGLGNDYLYVYDKGYTDKTHLSIETLSGIKHLTLQVVNSKVKTVTVDMGKAEAEKPITP